MATSAFKSTTKRTPIETYTKTGDSGSSNKARRRSRSLSQFSRRLESAPDFSDDPVPKGIIVNTSRGSVFPEISLDDLAIEFFPTNVYLDAREGDSDRRRLSRRSSEIDSLNCSKEPSQRRGRSVTRRNYHSGDGNDRLCTTGGAAVANSNSGRRRSVSVARTRCLASDSESYLDHSQSSSGHANTQTPKALDHRRLERSVTHKDISQSHDDYSSHSSTLTDEEATDARYGEDVDKIIRAVYARKKADHPMEKDEKSRLYEAMRKELGYAVEEIRIELEQAMIGRTSAPGSSNPLNSENCVALRAVSAITKSYETKLEKSEKRKQDLLAEMELEEQRGKELSKRVRELLPDSDKTVVAQKPWQVTKSNEKKVGKYLEELISTNVEETDISSFDREKSDDTSTFRGTKPRVASEQSFETKSSALYNYVPVEMDGINFPWLKWDNAQHPVTPRTLWWDPAEADESSSSSSWSPGFINSNLVSNGEERGGKACEERSSFDMEEYVKLEKNDQLLFLSWKERHRIYSGGLLLCNNLLL